ncbi:MAG: hypothetical protein KBC41_00875 [Candidatus Pacebacteria bacterium]|nr:hypothetical protein [Candidatus Paceibacterota bacterium]MBP9866616.1 hypothetical protein [Candidatus Paceibacterota bacterium]
MAMFTEEDVLLLEKMSTSDFVAEAERIMGKDSFDKIMKETPFRDVIVEEIRAKYIKKEKARMPRVSQKRKDYKRAAAGDL